MTTETPAPQAKSASPWVRYTIEYGPLLVFFLAYKLAPFGALMATLVATGVFMVAIVLALIAALALLGRVPPITWLSAILVIVMGGFTLYLRDPRFIQMKPTIIYALLALVLFGGLMRKKPVLQWLFGDIFPGLSETGWLKLTRNWAAFFLFLAIANEVLRAMLSFDDWLTVKVWGVTIASVLFAAANVPMLLRYGLDPETKDKPLDVGAVE
jgi:intracellular septation protein